MSSHTFDAEVWVWEGNAAWRFVTLPEDLADEVDAMVQGRPSRGSDRSGQGRGHAVADIHDECPD